MANLTVLPIQQIGPIYKCENTRIISHLAGAGGITAGQAVYTDGTTGTALPTNAATSGKFHFKGIALETVGAGQAVDVIEEGFVGGFDLSALAYSAAVFLSDTAGLLATAAGTNSMQVGEVRAISDRDPATGLPSKVLYVRSNMNTAP